VLASGVPLACPLGPTLAARGPTAVLARVGPAGAVMSGMLAAGEAIPAKPGLGEVHGSRGYPLSASMLASKRCIRHGSGREWFALGSLAW
jgi:hypothetical protein